MPLWARSAFANSVSDVYASTHVEQEKGCPYPALAPLQLSQRQPVCQLCRERQPVRDIGLNLDQCRGVRSHSKKCCTVYRSNLIHEFASFVSTKVIYEGLPRKTLPWKQEKVDTGHRCFFVVAQATPYHVLETFRHFLDKVTWAAQSDFGLVQLQVERKLVQMDLSWCAKE